MSSPAPATRKTHAVAPNALAAGAMASIAGMALALSTSTALAQDEAVQDAGVTEPAAVNAAGLEPQPLPADAVVTIPAFSEALELTAFVDLLQQLLDVNIIIKGELTGTWVVSRPIQVRGDELLTLANELLEAWGYSITRGRTGIYTVQPVGDARPMFDNALATARIIRTPNVRPSALQTAIDPLINAAPVGGQAGGDTITVSYIDDLGVIVAKGTPGQLDTLASLVTQLLDTYAESTYHRISLEHVAAPAARERTVELLGGSSAGSGALGGVGNQVIRGNNQNRNANALGIGGGGLDNIADRLSVDPQGNALIFFGTLGESEVVTDLMFIIDQPNRLEPREYFAGSNAQQIADFASRNGLGTVVRLGDESQVPNFQIQGNNANFNTGQTDTGAGGPTMVVNERQGTILYYGTRSQQARLAQLIDQIDAEDERIVVETYRLRNADSETVADLISQLINEQAQGGDNSLLPNQRVNPAVTNQNTGGPQGTGGFTATGEDSFVIADIDNNQVVVKAPVEQQKQIAELVEKLDVRRAQVYIEATIVAIDNSDDFRFAVETQIIAGQFGFQTNNGLSAPGADILQPRGVATGLSGLTSAVVQSDFVPFILNTVQTDSRGRIISQPQLLVNDNEEATVNSNQEEPTATTSQGDGSTVTGFEGFQEAGTSLTVTPSISEAGYITLDYSVVLSNFVGSGTDTLPPARVSRDITGVVTIPSDATIILGGIVENSQQKSKSGIPLLRDIPLIGSLFADTSTSDSDTILYVFITPRILSDPNFNDLRLLSEGPQAASEIDPDVPVMKPQRIDILEQSNQHNPQGAPNDQPQMGDTRARQMPPRSRTNPGSGSGNPSLPPELSPSTMPINSGMSGTSGTDEEGR